MTANASMIHTARRAFGVAVAGAALLIGGAAPAAGSTASDAIAALDAQRALNGIPALVNESPALTLGCQNHDNYMRLNGALIHGESVGSPGYTPEGAMEAPGSSGSEVLGFSGTWDKAWTNPWSTAPIHLGLMFDPSVNVAGYAFDSKYTCMRMSSAFTDSSYGASTGKVYSYPGAGAVGVPPSYTANEAPYTPAQILGLGATTGFNILLWNKRTHVNTVASASLTGPNGPTDVRVLDRRTQTPSVTLSGFTWAGGPWQWTTMVVPAKPLDGNTTYTLSVTFTDGTPYQTTFRTAAGAPGEPHIDTPPAKTLRISRVRLSRTRLTVVATSPARVSVKILRGRQRAGRWRYRVVARLPAATLRANKARVFAVRRLAPGRYRVVITPAGAVSQRFSVTLR